MRVRSPPPSWISAVALENCTRSMRFKVVRAFVGTSCPFSLRPHQHQPQLGPRPFNIGSMLGSLPDSGNFCLRTTRSLRRDFCAKAETRLSSRLTAGVTSLPLRRRGFGEPSQNIKILKGSGCCCMLPAGCPAPRSFLVETHPHRMYVKRKNNLLSGRKNAD